MSFEIYLSKKVVAIIATNTGQTICSIGAENWIIVLTPKLANTKLNTDTPITIDEKKDFLLDNNIALWDVIASCDIEGSSDSSIKNVVANDLNKIIDTCDIKQIFCNGGKSFELYKKYCEKNTNLKAIKLPSTSPANARFSLEKLVEDWKVIQDYI